MILKILETKKEKIKKQDVATLRALWKTCFHDTKEYMDYYFKYKLKDNRILAWYQQEEVVAMLHLNPFQIAMNQKPISAPYIVGVATEEVYRKKGLMRTLLIESMQQMYQEKVAFSYLMPASDKIYTPFGFRYIYAQERFQIAIKNAEKNISQTRKRGCDEEIQVRVLDAENIDKVLEYVNSKLNKEFNLYTIRTLSYYKRLHQEMIAAGGTVLVFTRNQVIVGVVPFMMEGKIVEVVECIIERALTQEVMIRLMQELDYFRKARKNESNESEDKDSFEAHFFESYFIDINQIKKIYKITVLETKPIIMARIINLTEYLGHLTSKVNVSFTMKVKDAILSENNHTFLLEASPKGCLVTQTQAPPDFLIDIENLAPFLFGMKALEELVESSRMKITEEVQKKLSNITVFGKVYINEIV